MILATDLDGCISDHDGHLCEWAARILGQQYTPATLPHPSPETARLFRPVFEQADYWHDMPPMPKAAYWMRRLIHDGVTVNVHTFRPRYGGLRLPAITMRWLRRWCVPYWVLSMLTLDTDRYDMAGDVFLEDSPTHAQALAERGKRVLLMHHPYNENVAMPAGVVRVASWQEVYDAIMGMAASE